MTGIALRVQHTSLQFSDSPKQQEHDVTKIFVEGTKYPIKTGTEAGPVDTGKGGGGKNNRELILEFAERFNHAVNFGGDSWVAVDKAIIHPRTLEKGDLFLVSNDKMVGHGSDRIMPWLAFDHIDPRVGRIYQGAVHYPTKGALKGSPNYAINVECSVKIGQWLSMVAAGKNLGFVNGDFNMNDHILDVALGQNFTTMADELHRHQNTGHGPIDGMCSYDKDGRVSARRFNVLDDSEFRLFSDHYACRGTWEIEPLKEA